MQERIKNKILEVINVYDTLLGAGVSQDEIDKIMSYMITAAAAKIESDCEYSNNWLRKYKEPEWNPAKKPGDIKWWTNPTCTRI